MKDAGERKHGGVIYSVTSAFPVGFLPPGPSLEFIRLILFRDYEV